MIENTSRNKRLTHMNKNFRTTNDASKRYQVSEYLMQVVHPSTAA